MRLVNFSARKGFLAALIFLCLYPTGLLLWLKIKPYYGALIGRVGVYLAAEIKRARVVQFKEEPERNTIKIKKKGYSHQGPGELELKFTLWVSRYTFNVPLTWALAFALFPFIRWRKIILFEITLILMGVHFLYVFSWTGLQLYYAEVKVGFRAQSYISQFFWEFLWSFTDNMIIRFEPFLVALYLLMKYGIGKEIKDDICPKK